MARMSYEETMAYGAGQYADILAALLDAGLPAEFTQTGGMCAAIQIALDAGHCLLLTDLEDTLPWERADHDGWFVGLYEPEERRTVDGPLRWLDDPNGSAEKAIELVRRVLRRDYLEQR